MKDTQGKMETTTDFVVTDNNHVTKADDKYDESIDLSNACREFYQSRKRAAEVVKEKLANSGRTRTTKKKTSIDIAMETLRSEMASLMDQDLSLMKQLLTLNETIEDLKWQKKYYHSQSSVPGSSCDLSGSDLSISDTDMYDSENEIFPAKTTSSPITMETRDRTDCTESLNKESNNNILEDKFSKLSFDTSLSLTEEFELYLAGKTCHTEQNSFDSGIHDFSLREQLAV
ncbi:hypothetical protein ACF0H5_005519 [Mactra antiquata]